MAGRAPVTRLSLTERLSTAVVRVIRHPGFVLAYTAGTAYWWLSHPPAGGWAQAFSADAYPWPAWTSCASLLALWIESAVGISQFYSGRRDAVAAARTAELMRATAAQSEAQTLALGRMQAMEEAQARRDEAMAAQMRALRAEMQALRQAQAQPPPPS